MKMNLFQINFFGRQEKLLPRTDEILLIHLTTGDIYQRDTFACVVERKRVRDFVLQWEFGECEVIVIRQKDTGDILPLEKRHTRATNRIRLLLRVELVCPSIKSTC
jgi:hypothetical protein